MAAAMPLHDELVPALWTKAQRRHLAGSCALRLSAGFASRIRDDRRALRRAAPPGALAPWRRFVSAWFCVFSRVFDIPRDGGGLERSGNAVEAPLHGVVAKLHVALGDVVEKGAPVLQMEAMKLIHTLKATVPGRIEQINCNVGDTVPAGAILIEIAPAEVEEKP